VDFYFSNAVSNQDFFVMLCVTAAVERKNTTHMELFAGDSVSW